MKNSLVALARVSCLLAYTITGRAQSASSYPPCADPIGQTSYVAENGDYPAPVFIINFRLSQNSHPVSLNEEKLPSYLNGNKDSNLVYSADFRYATVGQYCQAKPTSTMAQIDGTSFGDCKPQSRTAKPHLGSGQ